jgi:hypothetical protein
VPGTKVELHAFRRDELRVAQLKLDEPEVPHYKLTVKGEAKGGGAAAKSGKALKVGKAEKSAKSARKSADSRGAFAAARGWRARWLGS